ncbi:MAG: hypothetical protein R3C02_08165 [Planctomycetaceae bacterium]
MRLNLLLACAVVAGVIGVSVFAQSDDGLFPETEKNFPAESFEQDERSTLPHRLMTKNWTRLRNRNSANSISS